MSCDKCSRAYNPLVGFYIISSPYFRFKVGGGGGGGGGFLQKVKVDDDAFSRLVRY